MTNNSNPQEWKECKLGDITSKIGSGATPNGGENSYKSSGITLIRSQNVYDFHFDIGGLAFIDEGQAKLLNNVFVQENDILMNITGESVTRCCLVPTECLPARVNQHVSIIRPKGSEADYRYVFYHLHSIKSELNAMAEIGCTRRALTKQMLEGLSILLPPLPEQRAIAGVLSSLDDKIDLLHRQNKTLEGMAEALWQKMFVEEADPGWEKGKLGDIADNIRESISVEKLQNYEHYVGLEHIGKKHFALYDWGNATEVDSNKSLFKKKDILFGKLRAYFHKVCFAPIDGICSTDILVIRPQKQPFFSFCLLWFSNEDVVNYADASSGGTRMPRTNWDSLSAYEIAIPPEDVISKFNCHILPMIDKVEQNVFSIRTLSRLRDTLLPKLMSGEVKAKI